MEEQIEETCSDKTMSDEESYLEYDEPDEEWEDDIHPNESISQVSRISAETSSTVSQVSPETSSISTLISGSSSVWLYFDKNPSYAQGFNVCKKCSFKYKITTSVTTLREYLKKHQLRAL